MSKRKHDKPEAQSSGVSVTFIRPHTHAGRDYAPGEKVIVRPATRERLIQFGVIEAPKPQGFPLP
jgi:hypothetical protein